MKSEEGVCMSSSLPSALSSSWIASESSRTISLALWFRSLISQGCSLPFLLPFLLHPSSQPLIPPPHLSLPTPSFRAHANAIHVFPPRFQPTCFPHKQPSTPSHATQHVFKQTQLRESFRPRHEWVYATSANQQISAHVGCLGWQTTSATFFAPWWASGKPRR